MLCELSFEQIDMAHDWYSNHKNHVNRLYYTCSNSYPPTLAYDKNNPSVWKPEHWKWFIDKYC